MTKERKLAINMWLWIKERYDEWDDYFWGASDEDGYVEVMKHRFIEEENGEEILKWRGLCWLCNYMRIITLRETSCSCERCPLKSCGAPDSAYQILNTHCYKGAIDISEEFYRYCCTTILNALGYKGE